MNKIRNGHDHATWVSSSVQTILDEHGASTDFQNKRLIAKANRAINKGISTYCGYTATTTTNYLGDGGENQKIKEPTSANDSSFVPINNNDIYLEVVGGKNEKGNVYRLGKLTNKFMRSTHILTNLIDMSMVQQMEEIHETIHKLNNELLEKKQLRRSPLKRKTTISKNGTTTSINETTKSTNATYFTTFAVEITYVSPTTSDNNDDHRDNAWDDYLQDDVLDNHAHDV
ncbi:hypothetical protein CR513_06088, partial [Mucuna pruriens]